MNEQSKFLERGEDLLFASFVLLIFSAYLIPQVMLGLLAFVTAPVSLVSLFLGVIRARGAVKSICLQATGFLLLVLAAAGLFSGTFLAAASSAGEARREQLRQQSLQGAPANASQVPLEISTAVQSRNPPVDDGDGRTANVHWVFELGRGLAPVLMGFGLLCWTRWSIWRCLAWATVVLLVVPTVKLMFQILGSQMVLSA